MSTDPPPSKPVKYLLDPHDPEQIERLVSLLGLEEDPAQGDVARPGETDSPENG